MARNLKITFLILILSSILALNLYSQKQNDWENHQLFQINKEAPHASLFPFENTEAALADNMEQSPWFKSLNGVWKFNLVQKPADRPLDFYKESFDVSEWDLIPVPSNWEVEGYDYPIYLDERYPFEAQWPDMQDHYNPVGSYVITTTPNT